MVLDKSGYLSGEENVDDPSEKKDKFHKLYDEGMKRK